MTANSLPPIVLDVPSPHPGQIPIYLSKSRFFTARCGRRFGKSKLIPVKRIRTLLVARQPVAYFAPTYKMLKHFWRETKAMLAPVTKHVSTQDHRLELIGGGSYDMWSLDNPDAARGQKYAAGDCDEAAMIPELEEAWNAVIRPTLTDYEGSFGFWSTPKGLNYFHTLCARGADPNFPDWEEFHFPTSANPYIKASEIEQARQELPEMVFKQEYLAEFIQGEGAVFRNIQGCLTNVPTTPEEHKGHTLVAGVDWGKVNDFTVISIVCEQCRREVFLDRFNQIDWHFQRGRLDAAIRKWHVAYTLLESNSIGEPNIEELQRLGVNCGGFQTTAQSKPMIIQSLALAFEKEEYKFLADDIATRELEAYEAQRSEATGRISYNAPAGFHDDTVIARALVLEAILERQRNTWTTTEFRF
jgi:hypothetical protein